MLGKVTNVKNVDSRIREFVILIVSKRRFPSARSWRVRWRRCGAWWSSSTCRQCSHTTTSSCRTSSSTTTKVSECAQTHKLSPIFTCLLMSVCKPLSCSDRAYFIDFEYGAFNYEPYDIANHFNEWAGTVHSVKLMFIVLVSYC